MGAASGPRPRIAGVHRIKIQGKNAMIPPKEFIRKIKPFSLLTEQQLDVLISGLGVEFYRQGKTIFKKGDKRVSIYIVFSGLVSLSEDRESVDYIARGEAFGIMIFDIRRFMLTARAVEDTICYSMPLENFMQVFNENERFSEFFKTIMTRRFRSFRSTVSERKVLEESSISLEVDRIMYRRPVACGPDDSIAKAAAEMDRRNVSSVIAVDGNFRPVGILTHKDLRLVILKGNRQDPVSRFMSAPVLAISSKATVFEAFAKMVESGVDHLAVVRNDVLAGVITRKDIQIHLEPSFSIFSLYRRALKSGSIKNLKVILESVRISIAKLALSGVDFFDLSKLISTLHDVITVKAVEVVDQKYPITGFTWIHMGSSGRKEEILATDQDNAIIYGGPREDVSAMVDEICDNLAEIGVPKCPGNYMASNEMWNRSLPEWCEYFRLWFAEHVPDYIRYLTIFLDMRPIYGDMEVYGRIVDAIKSSVTREALELLASDATDIEPPLGLFGIRGLSKGTDIKTYALYPIINGVRVLSVQAGLINVTNTRERLDALQQDGVIAESMGHDLRESLAFLQDLRLRRHARKILQGAKADNLLATWELPREDLLVLKETFKVIRSFQKYLVSKFNVYRPPIVREL